RARHRVGNVEAHWDCLGGIDVDPAGLRDFERLAGVPGTLLDLFTRDQYIRFHGTEPPAGWREATPEDIRRAAGGRLRSMEADVLVAGEQVQQGARDAGQALEVAEAGRVHVDATKAFPMGLDVADP
ncbi:hypothetical protein ACV35P_32525, partial [Pseudomonas aeruginosa]